MSTLIGMMFSIAVTMAFAGVRRLRTPGYQGYIAAYGELSGDNGPKSFYGRWIKPSALKLARMFGSLRNSSSQTDVLKQLDYAGNPGNITPDELFGTQLFGATIGLIIGGLWHYIGLPFGAIFFLLLPIVGFMYPRLWLRGKVRRRQHAISIALPDLLDMLAVCVSAGMGFDIALGLLTDNGSGPLYEELRCLLRELSIGEPRDIAFRRMAERNSSERLRTFIDALLQAEELGTPVAQTLQRQAEDIRIDRRHKARAEGSKAATKISLAVVFVVMPSVLCVMLSGMVMVITQRAGELGW